MIGIAVKNEVWRDNRLMAGGTRKFYADNSSWHVSYYISTSILALLPTWIGTDGDNKEGSRAPPLRFILINS